MSAKYERARNEAESASHHANSSTYTARSTMTAMDHRYAAEDHKTAAKMHIKANRAASTVHDKLRHTAEAKFHDKKSMDFTESAKALENNKLRDHYPSNLSQKLGLDPSKRAPGSSPMEGTSRTTPAMANYSTAHANAEALGRGARIASDNAARLGGTDLHRQAELANQIAMRAHSSAASAATNSSDKSFHQQRGSEHASAANLHSQKAEMNPANMTASRLMEMVQQNYSENKTRHKIDTKATDASAKANKSGTFNDHLEAYHAHKTAAADTKLDEYARGYHQRQAVLHDNKMNSMSTPTARAAKESGDMMKAEARKAAPSGPNGAPVRRVGPSDRKQFPGHSPSSNSSPTESRGPNGAMRNKTAPSGPVIKGPRGGSYRMVNGKKEYVK